MRVLSVSCVLAGLTGLTFAGGASAANLISHFTFDTDASNAVSSSLDGTLENGAAISSNAQVGPGSLRVDGVDDYVNTGTDGLPGAGGGYLSGTVMFWFQAGSGIITGNRRFIGQQNGNPASFGSDNRMSFEISTNGAGSVQAFIRTADGSEVNNRFKFRHEEPGSSTAERFPTDWADGEWQHLAFTWDIDSAGLTDSQIFINGLEVGTVVTESSLEDDPVKAPVLAWEDPGLFLGARNNRILQGGAADGHVDGWIDDFRVYDGRLSLTDVQTISGVPEPATAAVLGLTGLAMLRRRSA